MRDVAPASPEEARAARRGRLTLLLIAAVCLAPIVASYTIYYFFPRNATANYGTLLAVPASAITGSTPAGAPFALSDLHERWAFVAVSAGACEAACARDLYATRQARTMQGREQDRVVRVLLVGPGGAPAPDVLAQHPGLLVAQATSEMLGRLPKGARGIYIVDPLGNLVLHFPADPDIKRMANDLGRLLRASSIG
jgi:hypothetical protein